MINKIAIIAFLLTIVGFIVYTEQKQPEKIIAVTPVTITPTPYIFNEDRLFSLIQEWKMKEDGYTYKHSDFLCSIAEKRLEETEKNWTHKGFEADRFCDNECTLGENLGREYNIEEEMLSAWLNSPLHKKNLDSNYTHSCIKCNLKKDHYCVQIFGYY